MEEELIYMIHRHRYVRDRKLPLLVHGAFKTYRGASEWLIEQGYSPYCNLDYFIEGEYEEVKFIREDEFYVNSCQIVEYTLT